MTTTLDIFADPTCPWCLIGKAELDQALFSLDGYKKVTDAEFQAAQQQKMMQMYMPK